jgi:glycosyltransferase involved in cell wall biosynthesis
VLYVHSNPNRVDPTMGSPKEERLDNALDQDANYFDPAVPRIESLPLGIKRPLWSVMIPTYNCARYLRETLRSVLAQDLGPDAMQIEVIDDCSTLDDPAAVVKEEGKGRVLFYRKQTNEGATKTFNTCIERSKGHLVHVLHGDDAVCPGYYSKISDVAALNPDVGLISARCFMIDEDSEISGVFQRVKMLEVAGNSVIPFLYTTPIVHAGVTVRREAYEKLGGYRLDLVHAADCEMFARIVSAHSGIILTDVLAYYRIFEGNDTSRLRKTGENVRDVCRLHELFARRYPEFSVELGRKKTINMALWQHTRFLNLGDEKAVAAHRRILIELMPFSRRCKWHLKSAIIRLMPWMSG